MPDQLTAKVEIEGVSKTIDAAVLAKLLDIGLGEYQNRLLNDEPYPDELEPIYDIGKALWEWMDTYIKRWRRANEARLADQNS